MPPERHNFAALRISPFDKAQGRPCRLPLVGDSFTAAKRLKFESPRDAKLIFGCLIDFLRMISAVSCVCNVEGAIHVAL